MLRAYRLVYPARPHATPQLWEWQQSSIDRVLWNASTFGRWVDQRSFLTWDALAGENARLWETAYRPRAAYAPWPTWLAWLEEYRVLLVTMQEVYEAHHGRSGRPCVP
jgi:hypothetical protein